MRERADLVLFNLSAAAVRLFIGIVFKEANVANRVGSLVMLLLAGLLLNHDSIPKQSRACFTWIITNAKSSSIFSIMGLRR